LTVLIIPRDMKENSIPQENFSAISAGKWKNLKNNDGSFC
jgi:hypothetical protein